MNSKLSKLLSDSGLTLISSLLATGVQQLVIYPQLSSMMTASSYGNLLAVMGVVNIIASSFGSELCNTILVSSDETKTKAIPRNIVCLAMTFPFTSVAGAVVAALLFGVSIEMAIVSAILIFLECFRWFLLVVFRINLRFDRYLIAGIWYAVGMCLGFAISLGTEIWLMSFLMGDICTIAYTMIRSEGYFRFSWPRFGEVLGSGDSKTFTTLVLSSFVGNMNTYFDRVLLAPILGSAAVSVYYVASWFGKSLSIAASPVRTVLLSYLSRSEGGVSRSRYIKVNMCMLGLCAIVILVSIPVSPIVTSLFYPTLIGDARPYLIIGNAASIVSIFNLINMTLLLRMAPIRWQLMLSSTRVLLYAVACTLGALHFGLLGFVVALLSANITISIVSFFIGYKYAQ